MKEVVEYLFTAVFAVILLVYNLYNFVLNQKNSKYPFIKKICILFIIHDIFLIPLEITLYIIIEGPQEKNGIFIAEVCSINAISEFFCITTFIHAEWMFAEMYAKIASKIKTAAELERKKREEAEEMARPAALSQI